MYSWFTHTQAVISLECQRTGRALEVQYHQQQKSVLAGCIVYGPLAQVLATLAVLAKNRWPKHQLKHQVNPSLDVEDKASSPCLKTRGMHRSRHSKCMDNTSLTHAFIHSDIFIFMKGTTSVSCSIDNTTQTPVLWSHAQLHCKLLDTHTDCISNSATLSNSFVLWVAMRTSWDFEAVKKWWGCALLCIKCCWWKVHTVLSNAFSCHWESCWSWKHLKVFCTLL